MNIEVSEADRELIAKWASVARTLHCARGLLEDYELLRVPDTDKLQRCIEELEDLTPVLDRLHQIVRNQIWIGEAKRLLGDYDE